MGKLTNLNPSAPIADADLPASIARDTEFQAADAAHVANANPHQQYKRKDVGEFFTPTLRAYGQSLGILEEADATTFKVNQCGFEVIANANSAAFMSFHRPGIFACHFGIGTDNQLKVGGWTMGSTSFRLWHEAYGVPVWQSPSDKNVKQEIRPIISALNLILDCKPVSFRYNKFIRNKKDFFGDSFQRDKVHYGFLANDFPLQDLVAEKNNGYLGLNYIEIIPFLVRAMQEQQEQITELQQEVKLLKA
jgi:hypothetical protein